MNAEFDRNLGEQPLAQLLEKLGLKPHDLVEASAVQMTHKMVTRAVKGRRLTSRVKMKVLDALNQAADAEYSMSDLFNY